MQRGCRGFNGWWSRARWRSGVNNGNLHTAEYDIASLHMVSFYCFVTKACARRPGAAASKERRQCERRTLLVGAAGELAGVTRARQARPSSACTFSGTQPGVTNPNTRKQAREMLRTTQQLNTCTYRLTEGTKCYGVHVAIVCAVHMPLHSGNSGRDGWRRACWKRGTKL